MDAAQTLWEAQARHKNRDNLIDKLESELGWTNEQVRVAAEELQARGLVRAVLNDYDGGSPRIIAFEV